FQAEDGIRDFHVTGVQTCALPISAAPPDRLALMLEDAAPRATVTEPRLAARLPYSAWPRLDVHEVTAGSGPAPRHDVVKLEHLRSEERRVGKEGRSRGAPEWWREE